MRLAARCDVLGALGVGELKRGAVIDRRQTAPALARLTSQLCLGEAPDLAPPTVEAVAPARFAAMA